MEDLHDSPESPSVSSNGQGEALGVCRSCYRTAETEPVQVKRDGTWVDSTVRRCTNKECRAVSSGSLEDRLAHVRSVYGYKYFGDYELSPEQMDAVGEALSIAARVPELLEALTYAREMLEQYEQARSGESFNSLRINAAIARATAPPMAALGPSTPGDSGTPTNTSTHTGDQPL